MTAWSTLISYLILEENLISGQHEESLIKILQGHHSDGNVTGTEIIIALAEHLLGKLSPGKSYIIDSGVERKGKCGCGFDHCNSDPVFGSTGLGTVYAAFNNDRINQLAVLKNKRSMGHNIRHCPSWQREIFLTSIILSLL